MTRTDDGRLVTLPDGARLKGHGPHADSTKKHPAVKKGRWRWALVAIVLALLQVFGSWNDPVTRDAGDGRGSEPGTHEYPPIPWDPWDPRDPYLRARPSGS